MINIRNKADCCGCNACVQRCPRQCIRMEEDTEGFLYPEVNHSLCIDCGLCEKVCPVINQDREHRPLNVFAAWNRDEKIRMKSSSGGIFTSLAEVVLQQGGVVFGARFDRNWEVVHDYTDGMDGLCKFRGSKYVQSRIGDAFRKAEEFLRQGRLVLFTGTPCQIAGLNRFLGKEYERLLAVDIVCHGVPSPKVWRKNLETLASGRLQEIKGISFRDKQTGWKRYSFSVTFSAYPDEIRYVERFDRNKFMRGFLSDLYLRPSCHRCPSKSGKSGADLTLADFWGIGSSRPELDDDKGVGLVLVHSSKGSRWYHRLNTLSVETTYEEALAGNPSMEDSASIPSKRETFIKKMDEEDLFGLIDRLTKVSFLIRLRRKLRRLLKK